MFLDDTASEKEYIYGRCLSENAVTKFKESIPLSFSSLLRANTTQGTYLNFTPKELDCYVDSTAGFNAYNIGQYCPPEKEVNWSEEAGSLL